MPNKTPPEVTDVSDLESLLRTVEHGLITFDGCTSSGKTTLMNNLAGRLKCPAIDLDQYLDRQRGEFVNALRLPALTDAIEQGCQQSPVVLVSGVCMREVLDRLQFTAAMNIYVQRNSRTGIPSDLDFLDLEDGHLLDDTLASLLSDLDLEIAAYHEHYRPRRNADVVYVRTGG
ncbi:hypothetical protein ACNRBH_09155 [Ralstonia pseudosolanacearum]|uniref:hypothetical protein n=1 Tax=Ralstonia pseudosolanacearum TaxID=1310165 RepID=UPI0026767811|nr:hypothetical protein [Ralstonia pseudosolanacearum]MDO3527528.1 hypothetical protein [Ralstonia pseudosolanacearum]MDO3531607.1 hypothetical protein [Ralstonia pseudosolanacearum]